MVKSRCSQWQNGPKLGQKQFLFNLLKNLLINFYWICFIMKSYIICCVSRKIPYLVKFLFHNMSEKWLKGIFQLSWKTFVMHFCLRYYKQKVILMCIFLYKPHIWENSFSVVVAENFLIRCISKWNQLISLIVCIWTDN